MSYDLLLLAHPDDEIFVYPILLSGRRCVVAYLTNGSGEKLASSWRRKREAQRSVSAAGDHEILWIGIDCEIEADQLLNNMHAAFDRLSGYVDERGPPTRLITHAWEGGHPDHDAAHLLSLALARQHQVVEQSLAFPYYRASSLALLPYMVMAPIRENGDVHSLGLSVQDLFKTLRATSFYSSQIIPLVGLFPGLFWRLFVRRSLLGQSLANSIAPQRPMTSQLLYERRSSLSFLEFQKRTRDFRTDSV